MRSRLHQCQIKHHPASPSGAMYDLHQTVITNHFNPTMFLHLPSGLWQHQDLDPRQGPAFP